MKNGLGGTWLVLLGDGITLDESRRIIRIIDLKIDKYVRKSIKI
jgi:hypothetical protein